MQNQKDGFFRLNGVNLLVPFILITSLFALWGFANDITNPMVAAFGTIMELPVAEASLVQFAFYGGYATMAIPAALFIRRYSYKSGILMGLALYAIGAFLFMPAASMQSFYFFCISLYVLTFGLAFLETTANPFILSLGSKETSTRRLNLAQAFNPMGSLTGMAVASLIVLPALQSDKLSHSTEAATEVAFVQSIAPVGVIISIIALLAVIWFATKKWPMQTMILLLLAAVAALIGTQFFGAEPAPEAPTAFSQLPEADKVAIRAHDLGVIRNPYVMIGCVVLAIGVIIGLTKMPNTTESEEKGSVRQTLRNLRQNKPYCEGVFAQVFYVAAQIMTWTFIIQYAEHLGIAKATAQNYNIAAMIMFLCARFISTYMMKYVNSRRLLAYFGIGAALCACGAICIEGQLGLICLVGISMFMSLMFPTIYGIALENVTLQDSTLGAAFLVEAIVGGALMPPLQGAIIDMKEIMGFPAVNISYALPLVCFLLIALYGFRRAAERR